jgi:hypothetical protein
MVPAEDFFMMANLSPGNVLYFVLIDGVMAFVYSSKAGDLPQRTCEPFKNRIKGLQ